MQPTHPHHVFNPTTILNSPQDESLTLQPLLTYCLCEHSTLSSVPISPDRCTRAEQGSCLVTIKSNISSSAQRRRGGDHAPHGAQERDADSALAITPDKLYAVSMVIVLLLPEDHSDVARSRATYAALISPARWT
jgi:hypothetical protein